MTVIKSSQSESFIDSILSPNPQKRAGEKFFLWWNLAWLLFFSGIVVTKVYETFDGWSYMKVGLLLVILPILLPLIFPSISGEAGIPWYDRFTTKANAFIFIISFIGNYFWTHYFYKVLGTGYSFPSYRFNDVPLCLYFITHSYFHLYHGVASIGIRALWRRLSKYSSTIQYAIFSFVICVCGYVTAVAEVATIASFPYYYYEDAWSMWVIGSGFYGLYFLISFPWFARIDEGVDIIEKDKVIKAKRWTLAEVCKDAFAYAMITTLMLDFWRLFVGNINNIDITSHGVSWIY